MKKGDFPAPVTKTDGLRATQSGESRIGASGFAGKSGTKKADGKKKTALPPGVGKNAVCRFLFSVSGRKRDQVCSAIHFSAPLLEMRVMVSAR